MRRTAPILVLSALVSLLAGCFDLGGYSVSNNSYGVGVPATTGALTVSNGSQSGDMGSVRSFAGAASRHSGYYDSYGANLRIDSEGRGWWVMSSINVTGDLAGAAFAPGTHRVFTSGTYSESNNVSVIGCSGPEYGNYTFDGPADEVTIDVTDLGGGLRRMSFEARFGGELTTGSVDYRIDSTAPRGI
jgi:hypothetical protein